MSNPRVRFAPSPTGPLHIGGLRTALYNYLFAKKLGGTFILRIEDTDRTRYVPEAEEYIIDSLRWCGILPDEGVGFGGSKGPYRQSDRKAMYRGYAEQLIASDNAYYAFDTPEELDAMRERLQAAGGANRQYNALTRKTMRNSLTLSEEESKQYIDSGKYVIRFKLPDGERVIFQDQIRGSLEFKTDTLDDKVLLKGDGMPTYHLANIVDDHLMEITHVIRGEEWLPSTPLHVLLYRAFDWTAPEFYHLPLILKPDGKGKLSKRDGAKFGVPVYPIDWTEADGTLIQGFKEAGYLPEAVVNFITMLGWSDGTDKEVFTLAELEDIFDPERFGKSGARYDPDKANWFNQQYVLAMGQEALVEALPAYLPEGVNPSPAYLGAVAELMKERITLFPEFYEKSSFFFEDVKEYEEKTIRKKWNEKRKGALASVVDLLRDAADFSSVPLEESVKTFIGENELGFGDVYPFLRIALSGSTKGPGLFEMIEVLGKETCLKRLDGAPAIFDPIAGM